MNRRHASAEDVDDQMGSLSGDDGKSCEQPYSMRVNDFDGSSGIGMSDFRGRPGQYLPADDAVHGNHDDGATARCHVTVSGAAPDGTAKPDNEEAGDGYSAHAQAVGKTAGQVRFKQKSSYLSSGHLPVELESEAGAMAAADELARGDVHASQQLHDQGVQEDARQSERDAAARTGMLMQHSSSGRVLRQSAAARRQAERWTAAAVAADAFGHVDDAHAPTELAGTQGPGIAQLHGTDSEAATRFLHRPLHEAWLPDGSLASASSLPVPLHRGFSDTSRSIRTMPYSAAAAASQEDSGSARATRSHGHWSLGLAGEPSSSTLLAGGGMEDTMGHSTHLEEDPKADSEGEPPRQKSRTRMLEGHAPQQPARRVRMSVSSVKRESGGQGESSALAGPLSAPGTDPQGALLHEHDDTSLLSRSISAGPVLVTSDPNEPIWRVLYQKWEHHVFKEKLGMIDPLNPAEATVKRTLSLPLPLLSSWERVKEDMFKEPPKKKGNGGRQPASDPRVDDCIDPKRAQRIIANRQSAARSKARQKEYVESLKSKNNMLRFKAAACQQEIKFLQNACYQLDKDSERLSRMIQQLQTACGEAAMQPASLPLLHPQEPQVASRAAFFGSRYASHPAPLPRSMSAHERHGPAMEMAPAAAAAGPYWTEHEHPSLSPSRYGSRSNSPAVAHSAAGADSPHHMHIQGQHQRYWDSHAL